MDEQQIVTLHGERALIDRAVVEETFLVRVRSSVRVPPWPPGRGTLLGDAGVNIVSLSANTAYWQTRYENNHRTLVCYKTIQGSATGNPGEALASACNTGTRAWKTG